LIFSQIGGLIQQWRQGLVLVYWGLKDYMGFCSIFSCFWSSQHVCLRKLGLIWRLISEILMRYYTGAGPVI